jgi:hypothetical protein
MERLILIIQTYESDTFNARALHVQRHEAEAIAQKLFDRLCEIVEEGGQMFCSGDRLAAILTAVREENRQKRKQIV